MNGNKQGVGLLLIVRVLATKKKAKNRHSPVAQAISSFLLMRNIANIVNVILWGYIKFLKFFFFYKY